MNDKVDKKQFEQDFKNRKLKGIKVLAEKKNDILYEVHLGETIVKQNQFDILLAKMDEMNSNLNKKMDEGFSKVNHRLDNVETRLDKIESDVSGLKEDMSEVKTRLTNVETILKKHDDAMVEHGWFNKPSFE